MIVTFDVPATGGSAITSYEVSTDDGATWQALATSGTSPVTGTVSSLTNGQEYTVRVRARNTVGVGAASAGVSVVPATVPAAPGDLEVLRGDRSAAVAFSVPAGGGSPITSYEVSVDDGASWHALTTSGTSPVIGTVSSLTNGQEYTVRVRARDAVTVTPAAVPDAPTGLEVFPGNGWLHLSFTAAAGNGRAVLRHEVSLDDGATWTTLDTGLDSGGTLGGRVTGLVNGTDYQVRVRAVNEVGPGPAGSAVTGVPVPAVPDAPADLAATPGNRSAGLTFAVPGDGGSTVLGYEASLDGGDTWQPLAVQGTGPSRTATLTGLVNGTTYTVRVRAYNEVGAGPAGAPVEVTPVPDLAGPPTGLHLASRNGGLAARFDPPADDGGSAVERYQVSVDDGGTWSELDTTGGSDGSRVATVTGLTNGISYAVRVRAVTAAGAGAPGGQVSGMPESRPRRRT